MPQGYSAEEVASMLGLSVPQVRAFVRDGVLDPERDPDGEPRFSFQDMVLLRTATGLVTERIPPRRVRHALRKMRERLPSAQPLTGFQIATDGDRIVVQDGSARWQAESGQVLLEFERAPAAASGVVAPIMRAGSTPAPESTQGPTADELYQNGCELEDSAPAEACGAYLRAVTIDPSHADAHVNLGRLLHEAGEISAAEAHYRLALAERADDVVAAFNLGVALEDLGRLEEAVAAYQQVIAGDPRNADAHYNAARLCEGLGRHELALRYLRTYRQLTPRR